MTLIQHENPRLTLAEQETEISTFFYRQRLERIKRFRCRVSTWAGNLISPGKITQCAGIWGG
jgi:hypothetical protein